ncbi:MAG: endonuclease/exonuclease/phosphatase family protein [Clostridia bacterium]|nr:endonuclease/exonuclease/phosphatase family protein [Clostridia bacterium]
MIDKIIRAFFAIVTAIMTLFYTPSPVASVNPANTPEVRKTQDVTVMTYNVYYAGSGEKAKENRAPHVIENIRRHMPDSFGLQEATQYWIDTVAENMPEYAYVGVGRDADGGGEASPIFYRKDKYALLHSGTFWLSKTPDKPSRGWDAMFNRVCTYAVLHDVESGFIYAHFNAHFDHLGVIARLESVSVVADKISSICGIVPVVFTGDLNDYEGGDMYNRVLSAGFRDTKALAVTADDKPTYHGYSELTEKEDPIDFIFVNTMATEVESYTVDTTLYDGMYASDHHPVISKITLHN